jgi:hypothetical protein
MIIFVDILLISVLLVVCRVDSIRFVEFWESSWRLVTNGLYTGLNGMILLLNPISNPSLCQIMSTWVWSGFMPSHKPFISVAHRSIYELAHVAGSLVKNGRTTYHSILFFRPRSEDYNLLFSWFVHILGCIICVRSGSALVWHHILILFVKVSGVALRKLWKRSFLILLLEVKLSWVEKMGIVVEEVLFLAF